MLYVCVCLFIPSRNPNVPFQANRFGLLLYLRMPDDFCMLFQFQREWNVLCTIESLNKFVSSAIVQWIFQCFDTFLLIFFIRRPFYFRFVWFFVLLPQQFWIFWRLFHLVSCLHNVTLVYFAKSTRILRTYISENTERFWKSADFTSKMLHFTNLICKCRRFDLTKSIQSVILHFGVRVQSIKTAESIENKMWHKVFKASKTLFMSISSWLYSVYVCQCQYQIKIRVDENAQFCFFIISQVHCHCTQLMAIVIIFTANKSSN